MKRFHTAVPVRDMTAYLGYTQAKDPEGIEMDKLFDLIHSLSAQAMDETNDEAKFTITMNLTQFTILKALVLIGNEATGYVVNNDPHIIED